jgi:hypothetical protein
MPKSTTTALIETLERRIAKVRRTRNLRELQRAGYLFAAATAGAAALLLVTALFGSTRVFAVIAWSTLGALVVTGILLGREARARWLGRAEAVAWIERRGGLGGRLRSLVEIDARGTGPGESFFLPLLEAETVRDLPRWDPRRLLGRPVPRAALAVAAVNIGLLLAALTLTPVLYPRVPDLVNAGVQGGAAEDALADWRDGAIAVPGDSGAGDGTDRAASPALARVPAQMQERIRQSMWGHAWDRVREALARAPRTEPDVRSDGPAESDEDAETSEEAWQLAERDADVELPSADGEGVPAGAPARDARRRRPAAHAGTIEPTEEEGATIETAPGAGNGSDPALYGPATSAPEREPRARFELGLLTRMRIAPRAAPGPGGAPARDRERAPVLAAMTRPDELGHEMPVPRAFEPIVRQVFAHREGGQVR